MRKYLLSIVLLISTLSFSQQASDYFPDQTGYKWNYKVIPLDSINNEIDSLTYSRADSFATTINFMGKLSDLVLSKSAPINLINVMPYIDSSYFSFENADGYQYFQISNLGNLISVLDTIGIDSSFLGVIQSFESWYSVFRFGQPIGSEFTIFSKDTTISINGNNFPLRFQYLGKRLADETIQVASGSYLCKKFLLSTVVSYIILPPVVFELFRLETTKWISQNVWLVQEITPSKTIDLTYLGYGSFTIPGLKTELLPGVTGIKYHDPVPTGFTLSDNYPNPFNPSTNINFSIPNSGKVSLKVFDIIGREVAVLAEEQRTAGNYSVTFNPGNLSSGVYFCILSFEGKQLTRKMIYLK